MNTAKFFAVEIVDKVSRMAMLIFAGIILGSVLAVAFYNLILQSFGWTLILIVLYCVAFSIYVSFTNAKRKVSQVEIFKDHLAFVFKKKNEISSRAIVNYNDIKSYKISPLTDAKNLKKENPDKNKYSLRVFGFKTTIEKNDGQILEFQDSYSDGVLMYSPAYVYRMLDVKRYIPEFPLELVNFDSKKDVEDFDKQFEYYTENENNLPLFKNKRYCLCLLKYTVIFAVIALLIGCAIAYILYYDLKDTQTALTMLWAVLGIIVAIVIPMYMFAFTTTVFGGKFNKYARNVIKTIIKE